MMFLLVGFGIVVRLIRFGCVVFFGVWFVVGVVEMGKDFTALCRCHDDELDCGWLAFASDDYRWFDWIIYGALAKRKASKSRGWFVNVVFMVVSDKVVGVGDQSVGL
jgi:hypothetical protein